MTDVRLVGFFQEWKGTADLPFSETAFYGMRDNLRTMSAYFSSFKSLQPRRSQQVSLTELTSPRHKHSISPPPSRADGSTAIFIIHRII